MSVFVYQVLLFLLIVKETVGSISSPWHFECHDELCQKEKITAEIKKPKSLDVCQLTCGKFGPLWPRPTGSVTLGNNVVFINLENINLEGIVLESVVGNYLEQFVDSIQNRMKKKKSKIDGYNIVINFQLKNGRFPKFTLDVDESYEIKIEELNKTVNVDIKSDNYYGARHALETMSQLIAHDENINEIQMLAEANIKDSPVYPYRGILLDTANNYIDKKVIMRIIEAMAMTKMNTLHWQLTDSQSFPYECFLLPLMSYYGAYSPEKIYTPEDIHEIIATGHMYGVRIIPEMNTPAHVGEGWQSVDEDIVTCFKYEPRIHFCSAPPCGQLNPINPKTYNILAKIYKSLLRDFEPIMFHMGGNNVNYNCWNSSELITEWMIKQNKSLTKEHFRELWSQFQHEAYDKLIEANNNNEIPVVLWSSDLVDPKYMNTIDPEKYIIQIGSKSTMKSVGRILRKPFKVIFSNYDSLYLNCGFSSWVDEGNNWCSPYKGWQHIYTHSIKNILKLHKIPEELHKFVLGSEAVMSSVQVDSSSVEAKLWPRTAALAERLWSDPETSWLEAETRFLRHRARLSKIGVLADAQAPEWCLQNPGQCQ